MKKKNYPRALEYFHRAIKARVDRTDLYMERANLYFIEKKYEHCIVDCTIVVLMVEEVHTKQKHSGSYVQALYLRAKAKQAQNKLVESKEDVIKALSIDEDDLKCKKLLAEVTTLLLLSKSETITINDDDSKDDTLDEDEILFEG